MTKLSFSGHESFICKQFWLKKVYDFSKSSAKFSEDVAVVDLGVGKNMVASLRFWGKAFGVLEENDHSTPIADFIFDDEGQDPYLEDIGTIWLLHYLLVKTDKASVYSLVFNEFRKERVEFTKEQLHSFLKRKCEESGTNQYNSNTINSDISVFFRNYLKPTKDEKSEIEDDFTGVLLDLDLLKHTKQRTESGLISFYKIEGQERFDLPYQIVLYCILDNYPNQQTLTFRELLTGINSPGVVFALNAEGLYNKLIQITDNYKQVNYSETAGNQILQFKSRLKPENVLNDYYG